MGMLTAKPKGLRVEPKYLPAVGEVCLASGPNCDDDSGYVWGEVMVDHHRRNNSHHPEFWEFENGGDCMDGINGMDLFDLVEMFFDWRAANLDRDAGAPMSLSFSCEKYKITGPLRHILFNTAERLGYQVK